MAKILLVASGKGGTGKTTISSNIAYAFASQGISTLLIDADSGFKGLDLALGVSDRVVYNFLDVLEKRVSIERAISQKTEKLHLLSAPYESIDSSITISQVVKMIDEVYDKYEFIIIDCGAGLTYETTLFAKCAHAGIIISTPDVISLRGAEKIALELENLGLEKNYLVLNRLRPRLILKNKASNIDDAIDFTCLPLLGIIPEDENIIESQNDGKSVLEVSTKKSAAAMKNISNRLLGKQVPIMNLK